jgi:RNA polymerase sigma-70 factor (ECF subfamily)
MRAFKDESDNELVEALSAGDKRAFEELFARYWKQSHNFVKAKVSSGETAKEIVQDVFTDLWDHRDKRQIHHFAGYLFRALKYKAIDHINGLITQKKYWDHYKVFIPRQSDQTQHDINYSMLVDDLEGGLSDLPEKTQMVFRLNRLQGRSLAEISKSMNLTEKAVQYHLTKSLKELKVYLKDYMLWIVPFMLVN